MPEVRALTFSGEKLWVGVEKSSGYLSLADSHFYGIEPLGAVHYQALNDDGDLWTVALGEPVKRYSTRTSQFETIDCPNQYAQSCLSANTRYVAVGTCRRAGVVMNEKTDGFSFMDLQSKTWQTMGSDSGLPDRNVLSLAVADDMAWVGGPDYLCLVNLAEHRSVAKCTTRAPVSSLLFDGRGLWVASDANLYYLDKEAWPLK